MLLLPVKATEAKIQLLGGAQSANFGSEMGTEGALKLTIIGKWIGSGL